MSAEQSHATIEEIKSDGLVKSMFEDIKADLFIKTGKTAGRHFLVKVDNGTAKPTLIALHL
jgi:hypothetical protein